ncbi:MAG: EutN/CcmL family microcompartment protein, partial [Lentimonas sp.]
MILARVNGNVVTSMGHNSLIGRTIVLCTPIDETGADAGAPFAAVDPLGAGMHARVFITTDG